MTKHRHMLARALALTLILGGTLLWAAWHQAESIQALPSSYIKLNQHGEAMADWAGPWACVLDRETGLLWEVKNDGEDIHDAYWTYSWFNGEVGQANGGDCYFEKDRCDTLDLIRRTNQQALCGVSRWRLPTRGELQSLIEAHARPGQAKIAAAYFPHTKKGDYWTSEGEQALGGHYQRLKEGAFAVSFLDGRASVLPYRNAAFVRLVAEASGSNVR
ncbi:MAG: DUF1566 domain-containing protein [Oleiphilaceae bacterium]|nr:DUF1566 domain-containing protein [Oleiphilaceae bacterium]